MQHLYALFKKHTYAHLIHHQRLNGFKTLAI
jgi:hypothetical protein